MLFLLAILSKYASGVLAIEEVKKYPVFGFTREAHVFKNSA